MCDICCDIIVDDDDNDVVLLWQMKYLKLTHRLHLIRQPLVRHRRPVFSSADAATDITFERVYCLHCSEYFIGSSWTYSSYITN